MSGDRIRQCIVHIGAEKTGTTSIQKYLGRHAEALLGRGYWYPRSMAEPGTFVHTRLSELVRGDVSELANAFEQEFRRAAKAGAHTAVLSSEFLHSTVRKPLAVKRIREFLKPFFGAIRVVYYARRQDYMLASMHSTAVRGGFSASASALSVYPVKRHYYFDHAAVCDLWAEVFGRQNMICRIYERDRLANRDIVDDFAAAIGLELDSRHAKVSANESLSFETMNVLLLLNASRHKDNAVLRRKLIATGQKRGGARIPMLTKAQAQAFLARFEASNRTFFDRYVDKQVAGGFADGFDAFPEAVPPAVAPREIVDFVFAEQN